MITANDIRAIVESNIEPSEPADSILAYLKKNNGKKLTARDVTKMREASGDATIDIRKTAGMTYIEWGNYTRTGGNKGGSILIAYTEAAPTIDATWVEERNPAHFSARVERNEQRAKVLQNAYPLSVAAEAINKLREARATLESLTAYGEGPLAADRYAILDLVKE